jgi:hypothetical protein
MVEILKQWFNESLHTNRRSPSAFTIRWWFRRPFRAQPLPPAAVGDLKRSAE